MKNIKIWIFPFISLWVLLCRTALALDLEAVEMKIHALTNQLRAEKSLPPLQPLAGLTQLARKHSQAMAEQNFFSHTDPQGRGPFERMAEFLPQLLSITSGENIAMRSQGSEDETQLATGLFLQWKNSPGHYANMINPSFRHLGVGLAAAHGNYYATQNFAQGLVLLQSPIPPRLVKGSPLVLRFEFLADFPPTELSVYVHVPDKKARFYTSSGSFYTGGGPITPQWIDKTHFVLRLPTDQGVGLYTLGIGRNGAYYDTPFNYQVVSAP